MNGDHFAEWFEHKLLPILPASVTAVMDNAPYHTVKTKESWAPTSKMLQADMQFWLKEWNISWKADMLKSELYELVKKSKPKPQYVCYRIALIGKRFCCRSFASVSLYF